MSQSVEGGQVDSAVFRTLFPGIHNLAQWSQTAALQQQVSIVETLPTALLPSH